MYSPRWNKMPFKSDKVLCETTPNHLLINIKEDYQKKLNKYEQVTETQFAILQQKFEFKCQELEEVKEKYQQLSEDFKELMQDDKVELAEDKLRQARDTHMKEIIDLKSSHELKVLKLEDKIDDLARQLESSNSYAKQLEAQISEYQKDNTKDE